MSERKYQDKQGRLLFVSSGISGGSLWMTVIAKGPISTKRYRGIEPAKTREHAQYLLDVSAAKKGWREVE